MWSVDDLADAGRPPRRWPSPSTRWVATRSSSTIACVRSPIASAGTWSRSPVSRPANGPAAPSPGGWVSPWSDGPRHSRRWSTATGSSSARRGGGWRWRSQNSTGTSPPATPEPATGSFGKCGAPNGTRFAVTETARPGRAGQDGAGRARRPSPLGSRGPAALGSIPSAGSSRRTTSSRSQRATGMSPDRPRRPGASHVSALSAGRRGSGAEAAIRWPWRRRGGTRRHRRTFRAARRPRARRAAGRGRRRWTPPRRG